MSAPFPSLFRSACRLLVAWAALLFALVPAACGDDPVSPPHDDVAGAWILESYDGAPLPVVLSEAETCLVRLVEGSLSFNTATRVRLLLVIETDCPDQPVLVQRTGGDFTYQYAGGALELTELGRTTPSLTGTVTASSLTLTDGTTPLVFGR